MGIEEVKQKFVFTGGATPQEQQRIKDMVSIFYPSDTAKEFFDYLVEHNQTLTFESSNDNNAVPGSFHVKFNVSDIEDKFVISQDGTISEYTFERAMMHEIIHAVGGSTDGGFTNGHDDNGRPPNLTAPGYDYVGPTVRTEQLIANDISGDFSGRASYHAQLYGFELAQVDGVVGESLTFGKPVGLVLVDDLGGALHGDKIDTTDRTDAVLLIGLEGSDDIRAGAGNDYLYGGTSDDDLSGGAGSDYLSGGAGNDVLVGGGVLSNPADPSAPPEPLGNDKQGDYLAGGADFDTYKIVGSDSDYNQRGNHIYYDANKRSDAWYILGLKFIDTVYDSDSSGEISIKWDLSPTEVYQTTVGFNFYDDFVDENFDSRSNFFYNDTNPNGNWQINTGPTTGVAYFQARNHNGGFSDYVIVQAGYGLLSKEAHNPLFAIELGAATFGNRLLEGPVLNIGTDADDVSNGAGDNDQLYGESGADQLNGFGGSDYLDGGQGNDSVEGGDDDDVLLGGEGNDLLNGGAGDDIISGDAGADELNGGDGDDFIVADNDDTVITGGDGYDVLVVTGSAAFVYSMAGSGIEEVRTDEGNDQILGSSDDDDISLGGGDDIVDGGAGDDILAGGSGDNSIDGGDGDDIAIFDRNFADYTISTANSELLVFDGEHTTTLLNVEVLQFADVALFASEVGVNQITGTADPDTLNGTFGNDVISGLGGNDTVDGLLGDDQIDGGIGDDFLNGGEGNDAYYYASGDGNDTISDVAISVDDTDVLRFSDLNIDDLTVSRSGEDMLITVNATEQVITVETQYHNAGQGWSLERLVFADGTSLELDHLPDTSWIYGTNASETIDGNWGKDYIIAGKGDDVINGSAGGDVYVYASGDGNDVINDDVGFSDEYNLDVLRFADLDASELAIKRHGDDVELTVVATGDVITLKGQMYEDPGDWGIDKIEFANGSSWNRETILQHGLNAEDTITAQGTSGDDVLVGTSAHDLIQGGQGNDFLLGGYGGDTYLYSAGDGSDYIDDEANSAYQVDILKFSDLNQADISAERDGVHLKLTVLATGDTITLDEEFYSSSEYWGIEKIEFADGTFWDRDDIQNLGETGTNMAATSLTSPKTSLVTANLDVPTADIIEFPASTIEVNVSDHELSVSENSQGEGPGETEGTLSAEIISLSDFLHVSEDAGATGDLWYEPEPIGAVI